MHNRNLQLGATGGKSQGTGEDGGQ